MFALIKNNIAIQLQPNKQDGFIEVENGVIVGMIHDGSNLYSMNNFSLPTLNITISEVKLKIWEYQKQLLLNGIVFDGHRHGGEGSHREYIATQYNLIKASVTSQYGSTLRDSDRKDQPMDDAKLCALYENGADYVSKINQAAMGAEDSAQGMSQAQLNSFDPAIDIIWPTNIYAYP